MNNNHIHLCNYIQESSSRYLRSDIFINDIILFMCVIISRDHRVGWRHLLLMRYLNLRDPTEPDHEPQRRAGTAWCHLGVVSA